MVLGVAALPFLSATSAHRSNARAVARDSEPSSRSTLVSQLTASLSPSSYLPAAIAVLYKFWPGTTVTPWLARHKTGQSQGGNGEAQDKKALKVVHVTPSSLFESGSYFFFVFFLVALVASIGTARR